MKHFIIVKFNDSINTQEFIRPIKNLFDESLMIDGIDKIQVYPSNTNLPNRHDFKLNFSYGFTRITNCNTI